MPCEIPFYKKCHGLLGYFLCDEEDVKLALSRQWKLHSEGYIWHGKQYFHVLVKGKSPPGFEWDHIDRNKLNNCRSNLRLLSNSGNHHNMSERKDNTSGVKGVNRFRDKWQVRIDCKHIGLYKTFEEAAYARREVERKLYPEIYGRDII